MTVDVEEVWLLTGMSSLGVGEKRCFWSAVWIVKCGRMKVTWLNGQVKPGEWLSWCCCRLLCRSRHRRPMPLPQESDCGASSPPQDSHRADTRLSRSHLGHR